MPSAFVSDAACSVASPSTYRSGRIPVGLIGREVSRISSWLPDHRIISDDNGCARFHCIAELVSEIATEAQSRSGAADPNAVAIHVRQLLRAPDQNHERTLGGDFQMPPIFARLEFAGRRPLGVKGWLFHRRRGCQQADGNGENSYELHAEIGR